MNEPTNTAGPVWPLPVRGPERTRPPLDRATVDQFAGVTSATACARLHHMGIRRTHMTGLRPLVAGTHLAGTAVTLQFMPQREDVASGVGQENFERHSALWAVLDVVTAGSVLVVQAYGSMTTGCVGDMIGRYLHRRGCAGVVIDGCVRDSGKLRELGLPVWSAGQTPEYASQSELVPWAYEVPISCGGALVLPGDVIVADDDGAVVVPEAKATVVLEMAGEKATAETFARERLEAGGSIHDYYPLSEKGQREFDAWRAGR